MTIADPWVNPPKRPMAGARVAAAGRGRERASVGTLSLGAIIFVVSAIVLLVTMNRSIDPYDEALVLEGASRVALGAVPHRDFYANYGPAQFYAVAALFKAFGSSVLVERAWDTVVRAGLSTVAFVLVAQTASRRDGLVAAGSVLLWVAALQDYALPLFPALLCALIAATCLVPVLKGEWSAGLLFVSGLSLGLTVLFRYDVGFYAFAAVSLVLAALAWTRADPPARRLFDMGRLLTPCWLGLALVCVPVAIGYATNDVLRDFAFDILDFPAHFYARMRGLPFPGLSDIVHHAGLASVYLPPITWMCAASLAPSLRRGTTAAAAPLRWLLLLLGLMSVLFYLKGVVRVSVIHMSLSIVPALVLMTLCLRHALPPRRALLTRPVAFVLTIGVAFTGLMTVDLLGTPVANAANNLAWAFAGEVGKADAGEDHVGSCRPPPELRRLACFVTKADRARAISYIVANSQPGDTLFEGVPRHDRIFINDMLIYFATGLRPASKWYHFDPGLQTGRDMQAEMVTELAAARPKFVVLDASWAGSEEPNDSSLSSGVRLLDDFIATHYHEARTFGAITLLQVDGP